MMKAKLAGVVVLLVGSVVTSPVQGQAVEDYRTAPDVAVTQTTGTASKAPIWRAPDVILVDNGPIVTHAGVCTAGADASRLQSAIGLNVFGFNVSDTANFRVADNFTVPAPGWNLSTVTVFSYQTGSTTTSTFDVFRVQIWNGAPNAGGMVVFGDTTTNRLASSAFSNIYRDLDTATCPTASTRPIMAVVANAVTVLVPGTYWVDVQLGGTLASGPWIVPTTLLGETDGCAGATLCDGLQWTGTAWQNLLDNGTAAAVQDIRFILDGTPVPVELQGFDIE